MSEEPVGSKDNPSPLDAYQTAAPDEPIFTLQGGDPVSELLVLFWVELARARCGLAFDPLDTCNKLARVIRESQVKDDADRNNLLTRATEAEQVAWSMKDYKLGRPSEAKGEDVKPVEYRLDLHDYRIYAAGRVSSAFSELHEAAEKLEQLGYPQKRTLAKIHTEIGRLRTLYNELEPRPGMQLRNG
ncbi:MAG: hypothetical protein EHM18_06935 [Acidobacteria bacterium]|nr:MAG: hypothetical protein EHM18_06935 [Acidobacteriota bacterium]